jgi:hypothetical protein
LLIPGELLCELERAIASRSPASDDPRLPVYTNGLVSAWWWPGQKPADVLVIHDLAYADIV